MAPFAWIVLNFIVSSDLFSSGRTAWMLTFALGLLHLHVDRIELLNHLLRKCGHFTAYAILGGLFFRAWRISLPECWRRRRAGIVEMVRPLWALRWSALAIASAALAAAFDEWHQSFVPSRTSTPWDVGIDTLGAIFLQLILMLMWIDKEKVSRE